MGHSAKDFTVVDAKPQDIDKLDQALAYLDGSPTGRAVMQRLAASRTTIAIARGGDDHYDKDANTLYWDPDSALTVVDPLDNEGSVGVQSAALGLAHEAVHALDENLDNEEQCDIDYDFVAERTAVTIENRIARELGEPERYNHGGDGMTAANPTEHTHADNDGIHWVETDRDGSTATFGSFQPGRFPGEAPFPDLPIPPSPPDTPTAQDAPATTPLPAGPSARVAAKLRDIRAARASEPVAEETVSPRVG